MKDQPVSMRITPETAFKIEFIGRVRGQNVKTVVERAVRAAAKQAIESGEIPLAHIPEIMRP